jgi:hypothetical protein
MHADAAKRSRGHWVRFDPMPVQPLQTICVYPASSLLICVSTCFFFGWRAGRETAEWRFARRDGARGILQGTSGRSAPAGSGTRPSNQERVVRMDGEGRIGCRQIAGACLGERRRIGAMTERRGMAAATHAQRNRVTTPHNCLPQLMPPASSPLRGLRLVDERRALASAGGRWPAWGRP